MTYISKKASHDWTAKIRIKRNGTSPDKASHIDPSLDFPDNTRRIYVSVFCFFVKPPFAIYLTKKADIVIVRNPDEKAKLWHGNHHIITS